MNSATPRPCPLCGGEVHVTEISLPIEVQGREVQVAGEHEVCAQCEEVFLAPGELDRALIAAARQVRQAEGLLAPDDIKGIRASLGVSQAGLEKLLGVGKKTVGRWERGTVVQSPMADTLLRMLRDVPQTRAYLSRERGVSIAVPVQTLGSTETFINVYGVNLGMNYISAPAAFPPPDRCPPRQLVPFAGVHGGPRVASSPAALAELLTPISVSKERVA